MAVCKPRCFFRRSCTLNAAWQGSSREQNDTRGCPGLRERVRISRLIFPGCVSTQLPREISEHARIQCPGARRRHRSCSSWALLRALITARHSDPKIYTARGQHQRMTPNGRLETETYREEIRTRRECHRHNVSAHGGWRVSQGPPGVDRQHSLCGRRWSFVRVSRTAGAAIPSH